MPLPSSRLAARLALLCALAGAAPAARAADYSPAMEGSGSKRDERHTLFAAGGVFAVGSDLGLLPHLAVHRDLPGAWQAGVQARMTPKNARVGYDYLPQIGLNLRKLWLGDEDEAPIRNSEYFGITLGGFFGYDFEGSEAGLSPFGSLSLGKYWMPFESQPFGLDLDLELTRYISGHLPGRSELVFITLGANVFYAL